MSELTREQKKDWAKLLFLSGLTQKEIAVKVAAAESTISRWASDGKWDTLKVSFIATKEEELARMYMQLHELNDTVMKREEGSRFVSNKEADTLSKLSAAIRNLETETSMAEIISVSRDILNWLRKFDLPKAQELSDYFDGYIKEKLK